MTKIYLGIYFLSSMYSVDFVASISFELFEDTEDIHRIIA